MNETRGETRSKIPKAFDGFLKRKLVVSGRQDAHERSAVSLGQGLVTEGHCRVLFYFSFPFFRGGVRGVSAFWERPV